MRNDESKLLTRRQLLGASAAAIAAAIFEYPTNLTARQPTGPVGGTGFQRPVALLRGTRGTRGQTPRPPRPPRSFPCERGGRVDTGGAAGRKPAGDDGNSE